jgi:pyridoxine/pyridoxamine 5'-phosphate oxidase
MDTLFAAEVMFGPMSLPDVAQVKAIMDANSYLTLGTADEAGVPWVSPVWFATTDCRSIFWVSSPEAWHSRNIAARAQVAIVIFDSQVPVGRAQAVYISAEAGELSGAEADRGLEIFSARSQAQGLRAWGREDVEAPARLRLYGASASAHFLLTPVDERLEVRF